MNLLGSASNHVFICSRTLEKGEAAIKDLKSRNLPGSMSLLHLDVTKEEHINAAADQIAKECGRLDVLINNAGIARSSAPKLGDQLRETMETNVIAVVNLTEAMAPLLEKSTKKTPRIINISSGAGSITQRMNPKGPYYKMMSIQYRTTKSALNMVSASQYVMYEEKGIKVFTFCPGFTVSNLGGPGHNTAENGAKPTADAATAIVRVVNGERDDEAGKFIHESGSYPW